MFILECVFPAESQRVGACLELAVVRGEQDRVKLKLLKVVEVQLGISETFDTFFATNNVDPATLPPPLLAQLPPNYAANYDPDRGAIVKQNKFVRNMASVLRINPGPYLAPSRRT